MKKTHLLRCNILITCFLMVITICFLAFPKIGLADTNNIFVEDYAGILSNDDKDVIKNINEDDFAQLPGKPQYVVVTLKNLDGYDSIEDYAEKKFKELGIGDKDLDNGFLFVISINDRKYRLETGYGVEDVITDSMKRDVVTDEAQTFLEDGQYAKAVMLISNNIRTLVNQKYGDLDAAKEAVKKEKEQSALFMKLVIYSVIAVILMIICAIIYYMSKIKKLRQKLNKSYISNKLKVFIYSEGKNSLAGKSGSVENINLSAYLAKIIFKKSKTQDVFRDESYTKEWIGQYLLVDSIITYWRQSNELKKHHISIYLDGKYLKPFKDAQLQKCHDFTYPLVNNPFLSDELSSEVSQYLKKTLVKHEEALRISNQNKQYVKKVCEQFLEHKNVRLKKIDYQLEVALMGYYFLKEKDLSDPNLLRQMTIDGNTLTKSYRFADSKRRKIARENRRRALDDLTNMTLANYYMQAMIWSSYNSSHSSSSFGGGGGSSFGGGSSGGGGFSGGW